MAGLDNDLLLRALSREAVPRTPVWIMRQAGRYLPEYREVRAQAGDFMSLCRNPELACEVTLQPLRRYRLDAAILFSDILTVPDAMGLGLHFETGEGPRFERPVRRRGDIDRLPVPDVSSALGYVFDAVRTIRAALAGRVPLIGFAGSPFTVATYMVEGGSSNDLPTVRALIDDDPSAFSALLDKVAAVTVDYLNAQVEAGAQALQIFDTWGAKLGADVFRRFSLAGMERIVDGLRREYDGRKVPLILFTKGAGPSLTDMAGSGADALGVDWTTPLGDARRLVDDRVALQGNVDPAILRESPEAIRAAVADALDSFGPGPGHVFNLGHGITPDIDPDRLGVLVDAVHELSPAYNTGK